MPERSKTTTREEFRICGDGWAGVWREWDPARCASVQYDARDYAKRNTGVRIERRLKVETITPRPNVPMDGEQ